MHTISICGAESGPAIVISSDNTNGVEYTFEIGDLNDAYLLTASGMVIHFSCVRTDTRALWDIRVLQSGGVDYRYLAELVVKVTEDVVPVVELPYVGPLWWVALTSQCPVWRGSNYPQT